MTLEDIDVAILGAGTAGLSARAEVVKKTDSYMVFDPGTLGTTCARVACMPSKAFLQSAHDFHRRHSFRALGIRGADHLQIDAKAVLSETRRLRDGFVSGVVKGMDAWKGDHLIPHRAAFAKDGMLHANGRVFRPRATIVATGSSPVMPATWPETLGKRVFTTDDFFDLETLPPRIAVIGLGPVGLELGQALARLGVEVTGFDPSPGFGGLSHPDLHDLASTAMQSEFRIVTATVEPKAGPDGAVTMHWDGGQTQVDCVLVAMGRMPNLDGLGLQHLGIGVNENGQPDVNESCLAIQGTRVYLAGDVSGLRPLLHEAADEGRIAGYNAVRGKDTAFRRRIPLHVTFTDPQIASVGAGWADLKQRKDEIAVGPASFSNKGRSQLARSGGGAIRVYAEKATARLSGVEMFAQDAEHLAHMFAYALAQGATLGDLLKMPFYHPTYEEIVRSALRRARKQCAVETDKSELETFRCDDTPVDAAAPVTARTGAQEPEE